MAHILNLNQDDPIIHLKAYGGVQIRGVDQPQVTCEIDAPELASLLEEDGHVYVTVNSDCTLQVPEKSSIEIERGMGSVLIDSILNPIKIDKVLGNLVLLNVDMATVDKVGGNFSVQKASGSIQVGKIACNLTIDNIQSFACDKVGGSCIVRDLAGDFRIEKAGGSFKAQGIGGLASIAKLGGTFKARDLTLGSDLKVGGDIKLIGCKIASDLDLRAGGDVEIVLSEDVENLALSIRSGGEKIKIKVREDDHDIRASSYDYQLGEGGPTLTIAVGGAVSVMDAAETDEEIIGDLSDHFTFEESAFSELVQGRIESATRRAEAKVRAAEIRLGQIQDRVEKRRGFKVDLGFGEKAEQGAPSEPDRPSPPTTRPAGKKGATDEERLMILKMLQDGKISVDEAETLFEAMES